MYLIKKNGLHKVNSQTLFSPNLQDCHLDTLPFFNLSATYSIALQKNVPNVDLVSL